MRALMTVVVRSSPTRLRAGALWSCLALSGLIVSCGRVGLEFDRPEPAQSDAGMGELDAGEPSLDSSEPLLDAEQPMPEPDATDAEAPQVDGCVPGATGGCATCNPASYEGATCGVGYCRSNSVPSHCDEAGVEIACVPGAPRADRDTTCDGVDDNCNGQADEAYVGSDTSCGTGACTASGLLMCNAGVTLDTCMAREPMTMADDASGSGNGIDDDCDGRIDEDVSPCDTTPRTFEAGSHVNLAAPEGCTKATVQLWGGAGGGGGRAGISATANGGRGGSGGYARSTLSLTGPLTLYVGMGGRVECLTPGVNPGSPAYSGGAGGIILNPGKDGADGDVSGGGQGATNVFGERGGDGYYGGGGGGSSSADPVNGVGGWGGGGGAASVALLNGALVMVAGGGGGGGGAAPLVYNFASDGGNGGEGCSGAGTAGATARTGGGGGGGVCVGTVTSTGSSGRPANAALVPAPRARGSSAHCTAGGDGYAIVTFSR